MRYMRKNILYATVFVAALIVSSFTVVATPENAPGQWKKNNEYASQREFVRMIHMRILERLQFSPAGLVKLVNIINEWATELEPEEEPRKNQRKNLLRKKRKNQRKNLLRKKRKNLLRKNK